MIGNMADNFTESTSTHAARAVSSLERSFNWFPVNSGPRLLVISASTATLLNVVLKRTRSTIVDDVVQALEVNPHTKSHCCKHHSSSSARQVSSALYFIFYSSSVTQLEAENAKLNDKAKLEEEKAKLEDEKSKLEDEKTKLEAKKAEVENERNSVRNEMDQLEEQMESLKMRTKRLS
ncbi:hypothetical protein EMCRGX_G020801 [Ephydatia muelleri]